MRDHPSLTLSFQDHETSLIKSLEAELYEVNLYSMGLFMISDQDLQVGTEVKIGINYPSKFVIFGPNFGLPLF